MALSLDTLTLSVVIPCYNEMSTIREILSQVRNCGIPNLEIIVVDDGSSDGTRDLLRGELRGEIDKLIFHRSNKGKGGALATGFQAATGDLVIIQDADLEYDPKDYIRLVEPFIQGRCDADVVYGSRYARGDKYMIKHFYHTMGNRLLTLASNLFTDLGLTDMETCYKMFKREVIQSINIEEKRFGFEPEITAKLAKKHCHIYEVPISYYPRSYEEGKKIGLKDAFRALYCIIKYNIM